MLSLISPLWRWIALAALVISSFGYGYVKGVTHEARKLEEFRGEVDRKAQEQIAKNSARVQQQKQITEETANAYAKNIDALRRYYDQRLRQRAAGSGAVPSLPAAPASLDAVTPDSLPLAGQCAETTEQLEALQDWVREQGK